MQWTPRSPDLKTTLLATLVLLTFHFVAAAELPTIRKQEQLNEETRVWVNIIESVRASGRSVSVYNDGTGESRKAIAVIVGPFVPLDKVEWAWVGSNGIFGLKFKKKHRFDIPLYEGGFLRVKIDDREIRGSLIEDKTLQKGIPIKILVFDEPHNIQIDHLDNNRQTTVPKIGRVLGMLPHIIAMAYLDKNGVPFAAPQFDGMGSSENPRLIKDLLEVDDTLMPVNFLYLPE
jgi:hypothetical protein